MKKSYAFRGRTKKVVELRQSTCVAAAAAADSTDATRLIKMTRPGGGQITTPVVSDGDEISLPLHNHIHYLLVFGLKGANKRKDLFLFLVSKMHQWKTHARFDFVFQTNFTEKKSKKSVKLRIKKFCAALVFFFFFFCVT